MTFKLACVLWSLDLVKPASLPEVAMGALTEGFDTPKLRYLSLLSPVDAMVEGRAHFEAVLLDLGYSKLTLAEAARECGKIVAKEILEERMDAMAGAHLLWDASLSVNDPDFHDLDPFIYAASEYQERPSERRLFEEGVRLEAQRLLR